jgi:tryptophan halogenase
MNGKHADTFRAGFKRGELFAQFGIKQARPGDANESIVKLSNCVVMPPATAKRLVNALNDVLRRHQASAVPRHPDPEADRLLRLVADLGTRYAFEHSFRIGGGSLLANRFLLSIDARAVSDKPDQGIRGLCDRLGMPADFLEATQKHLPSAKFVHFGFEKSEKGRLYKVYLEFEASSNDEAKPGVPGPDPLLLHLAFKWDTVGEIAARLSRLYGGDEAGESLQIAHDFLALAASRGTDADLQYLEVSEDDTGRRSFDLNVYDVNLTVEDLHPLLVKMCRVHAIPSDRLDALYLPIRTRRLGHVAGGIHRQGEDFFNIYYGVEWHHG